MGEVKVAEWLPFNLADSFDPEVYRTEIDNRLQRSYQKTFFRSNTFLLVEPISVPVLLITFEAVH